MKKKDPQKASRHFTRLCTELNIEKYQSSGYNKLFELVSFQNMHDADLAYHYIYRKCAENAWSKQSILDCLEQERKIVLKDPAAFNADKYAQTIGRAAKEIQEQLLKGDLDFLFI